MENRKKINNIFTVIEKRNPEELKTYLENDSFNKSELYQLSNGVLPIEHAAKNAFWEGMILLANHEKYNEKNANVYRKVLCMAIKENQIEAAEALLKANTRLDYFQDGKWYMSGMTSSENKLEHAIAYAIKYCPDNKMIITLLTYLSRESKKNLLNAVNDSKETPIQVACKADKLEVAELLFENIDKIEEQDYLAYIDKVSDSYQPAKVKMLTEKMKKNADANPLKTIITNWHLLKNHERIIRYLFDQGFNLTQCNDTQETPIEIACKRRNESCVRLLIEIDKEK